MGVQIVVDIDLCQGHGVCESEAPDILEVGRDRKVVILSTDPDVLGSPAVKSQLDLAVKYCPTHSLSLVEVVTDSETNPQSDDRPEQRNDT